MAEHGNGEVDGASVLIAEDDRAVRNSLERALVLEGYAVTTAVNGAEALDSIRASEPDVLLLDVSMPIVDGLTVSRVLRAEHSRLPILMLTARTDTSDRVAGLDAGADDYLPKPYDLGELLARLRALLRRSSYDRPDGESAAALTVADLRVDPAARRVVKHDALVFHEELEQIEFGLRQLDLAFTAKHSTCCGVDA
ncbi:MAG: response regulator, partial [Actinomycetota bacterium]